MRVLLFVFLILLFFAIRFTGQNLGFPLPQSELVLALGFLILAGFLLGNIIKSYRLPRITGYIIAGIFFGPYILGFLPKSTTEDLAFINSLALNIIAFTAGGELNFKKIKKRTKAIFLVILFRFLFLFSLTLLLVFTMSRWVPFFQGKSLELLLGIGLLFSIIQTAISPATNLAVITETDAQGPVTDLVLTVTVAMDLLVIMGFAVIYSVANILMDSGANIDFRYFLGTAREIVGAILLGIITGFGVILYIRFVKKELVLFLIALAFILAEIGSLTHTDTILICLTSGIVVENYSDLGEPFIKAIEKGSSIIYVVFFVIAGATLNFRALSEGWFLVILLVMVRLVGTFGSTRLGAVIAREGVSSKNYAWTGFLGQAGVSLGLALLVQKRIGGEIGNYIATMVFASIAVNQIIGPVLFRLGLEKSGEINAERTD